MIEISADKLYIRNENGDFQPLLGIAGGGGISEIPIASKTMLGGVKVGNNLSITADGVLSAVGGGDGSSVQIVTDESEISDDAEIVIIQKPDEEDTFLAEISDIPTKVSQLENDSNYVTEDDLNTLNTNISSDVSAIRTDLTTAQNDISDLETNKVDKIDGKGLSTNDFTADLKTKLDGIETGANKITVDTALSATSTNPVQNKAVNTAISTLNDTMANLNFTVVRNADINDYKSGGCYYFVGCANSPTTESYFQCMVIGNGNDAVQIGCVIGSTRCYVRTFNGSNWESWERVARYSESVSLHNTASRVDLNTITETGFYRLNGNLTNGPSGTNYGMMVVYNSEGQIIQNYTSVGGGAYVRYKEGDSWTAWGQLALKSDLENSLGKTFFIGSGKSQTISCDTTPVVIGTPSNDNTFMTRVTTNGAVTFLGTLPSQITITARTNGKFTITNNIGWGVPFSVLGVNIN